MSAVRCCCAGNVYHKFESCDDPEDIIYLTDEAYASIPGGDTVIIYNFVCFYDLEVTEEAPVGAVVIENIKATAVDCDAGACAGGDCTVTNACFTIEVTGVVPYPNGYPDLAIPICDPSQCQQPISFVGVNATFKLVVFPWSPSPTFTGSFVGYPGLTFIDGRACSIIGDVESYAGITVALSGFCDGDTVYLTSLRIDPAIDLSGGAFFEWTDMAGVVLGTALPNQLSSACYTGSTTVLGVSGTATVTLNDDSACDPLTEYNVAVNCEDDTDTIVVDISTASSGDVTALYGVDTYYVTEELSTDAPVSVTWSTDPCPPEDTWYEAVKCSDSLPGPPKIRYQEASPGTAGDGAVIFGVESTTGGCSCLVVYQATDIETLLLLPVGIHNTTADCTPAGGCSGCGAIEDAIPIDLIDCGTVCTPPILPGFDRICEEVCEGVLLGMGAASPEVGRKRPPKKQAGRLWSALQMVQAYAEAKLSGRHATPEVIAERQRSCFGDPSTGVGACEYLRGSPGKRFCGACGCGARREAILDTDPETGHSKLQFTKLRCPLNKPGFIQPTIETKEIRDE